MSDEIFYRPDEVVFREARSLPAELYNLARLMVAHSPLGHVFVPIRSMQYLAVLDREAILFVDGVGRRTITLAWQHFRPEARQTLADPVAYDMICYDAGAMPLIQRLQGDFARALQVCAAREPQPVRNARILPMKSRGLC